MREGKELLHLRGNHSRNESGTDKNLGSVLKTKNLPRGTSVGARISWRKKRGFSVLKKNDGGRKPQRKGDSPKESDRLILLLIGLRIGTQQRSKPRQKIHAHKEEKGRRTRLGRGKGRKRFAT